MKMLKFYVLLVVVVIDVSTAENCTNSTSADCCVCPKEECDSCPSGFYRLDTVYLPTTECSSVSSTSSPLNSTTPSEEDPTLSPINDITSTSVGENSTNPNNTLCVQNRPEGFYGNNGICIECKTDFENVSGTCSPITTRPFTTTPASTKNNYLGAIIGGACGGVVVLLFIIIVVVIVVVRRKRRKQPTPKRTFTDRLEDIRNTSIHIEPREGLEVAETNLHFNENTAQAFPTTLQLLKRYMEKECLFATHESIRKMIQDHEQSILDQLPPAPPQPYLLQSKAKKVKLEFEPSTGDMNESEGLEKETETGENERDTKSNESDDEETFASQQVVEKLKSVQVQPAESTRL